MRSCSVTAIALLAVVGTAFTAPSPAHSFCFEEAGARYNIPPQLLWSISKWESGLNPTAINYNSNGTYDYGLMQINTVHAEDLKRAGIPWDALADPCTNVMTGAWLLSQQIRRYGYTWEAIGSYHSTTPTKRNRYANEIAKILRELDRQQRRADLEGKSQVALQQREENSRVAR